VFTLPWHLVKCKKGSKGGSGGGGGKEMKHCHAIC
jgi:hypothetical protein